MTVAVAVIVSVTVVVVGVGTGGRKFASRLTITIMERSVGTADLQILSRLTTVRTSAFIRIVAPVKYSAFFECVFGDLNFRTISMVYLLEGPLDLQFPGAGFGKPAGIVACTTYTGGPEGFGQVVTKAQVKPTTPVFAG